MKGEGVYSNITALLLSVVSTLGELRCDNGDHALTVVIICSLVPLIAFITSSMPLLILFILLTLPSSQLLSSFISTISLSLAVTNKLDNT